MDGMFSFTIGKPSLPYNSWTYQKQFRPVVFSSIQCFPSVKAVNGTVIQTKYTYDYTLLICSWIVKWNRCGWYCCWLLSFPFPTILYPIKSGIMMVLWWSSYYRSLIRALALSIKSLLISAWPVVVIMNGWIILQPNKVSQNLSSWLAWLIVYLCRLLVWMIPHSYAVEVFLQI